MRILQPRQPALLLGQLGDPARFGSRPFAVDRGLAPVPICSHSPHRYAASASIITATGIVGIGRGIVGIGGGRMAQGPAGTRAPSPSAAGRQGGARGPVHRIDRSERATSHHVRGRGTANMCQDSHDSVG